MVKIVSFSGGRTSAYLAWLMRDSGAKFVFMDTGAEHPKTYDFVRNVAKNFGIDLVCLRVKFNPELGKASDYEVVSVDEIGPDLNPWAAMVAKYGVPYFGGAFCTDELKIRETSIWLAEFVKANGPFQVWYGMRTDESAERSKRYAYKDPDELYEPHEVLAKYPKYLGAAGIRYRLPIVDWTTAEVMDLLNGEHNPMYDEGFSRVGCFPCLASGDAWKIKAFTHDEFGSSQMIAVRQLEEEIGKSVFTSGIGQRFDDDSQGCRVCEI